MSEGSPRRSFDRAIPFLIIGFFVGLVILQSIFVVTAFRTFPGTLTAHPFQRGQDFNAILEQAEAQRALGWSVSIAFTQAAGVPGPVVVAVRGPAGEPIEGARVTVRAEILTRHAQVIAVPLTERGPGLYEAPLKLPIGGRWNFRAHVERQDGHFREAREIRVAALGSAP